MPEQEEITEHGRLRSDQRSFSLQDVAEANARADQIETKLGKYGTLQNIYTGANGFDRS